ncbi:hypothetical protein SUGI_0293450 [Cryptomeria japonica]|nr:hypothetical protein SUGI_0293450 [Cryptomeria japonica]
MEKDLLRDMDRTQFRHAVEELLTCEEYNVQASNINNKCFSIGTFKDCLPNFLNEGSAAKLFMHKEGRKGPQLTNTVRVHSHTSRIWKLTQVVRQLYGCLRSLCLPSTLSHFATVD